MTKVSFRKVLYDKTHDTFGGKELLNGFRKRGKNFGMVVDGVNFLVEMFSLVGGLTALLVAHD
jgi:hypothetical protein